MASERLGADGKKLPKSRRGTDAIDYMSPEEKSEFLGWCMNGFQKWHSEMVEANFAKPSLEETYRPALMMSYNRAAAYDDATVMKQTALEIEEDIRVFLSQRMRDKKMDMYVGTPKHWQVVDEEVYGKGKILIK